MLHFGEFLGTPPWKSRSASLRHKHGEDMNIRATSVESRIEHVSALEGYDRWAGRYDHEGNPLVALNDEIITSLAGDVTGLDVVELGCGTGRQTAWLTAAGARVTALDFSEGMLGQARLKVADVDVRFVQHDLKRRLPFSDATFDGVVSCLVLEHLSDLDAFFREARRVCRPGGWIAITDMHPALRLRGNQAHFHDEATGREVRVESIPHKVSDFVNAVLRCGLHLERFEEPSYSEELATRIPRAGKFLGWPMLVAMRMTV